MSLNNISSQLKPGLTPVENSTNSTVFPSLKEKGLKNVKLSTFGMVGEDILTFDKKGTITNMHTSALEINILDYFFCYYFTHATQKEQRD